MNTAKYLAFDSSRSQVAYLLNRRDVTAREREHILSALARLDVLVAEQLEAQPPPTERE
jgi:hypothetical protein